MFARTHGFVMIVDVTRRPRALQSSGTGRLSGKHTAYFKKHVVLCVFVAGSAMLRGALRAVSWLKPFPYPIAIEGDIEPAITTALAALKAAGERDGA